MLGKRYIVLVSTRGPGGYRLHHNAHLYERAIRAKSEAQGWDAAFEGGNGAGRVLEVDLDDLLDVDASPDERYQRAERRMLACLGELTRIGDVEAGRDVDKSDQDYAARVGRTSELKERAAVEVARLLEAFKPPRHVIETRRNLIPTAAPERTWHGREHDALWASASSWIAVMGEPLGDGAMGSSITMIARTEQGALARLLAHIVDGGGFYPMT